MNEYPFGSDAEWEELLHTVGRGYGKWWFSVNALNLACKARRVPLRQEGERVSLAQVLRALAALEE